MTLLFFVCDWLVSNGNITALGFKENDGVTVEGPKKIEKIVIKTSGLLRSVRLKNVNLNFYYMLNKSSWPSIKKTFKIDNISDWIDLLCCESKQKFHPINSWFLLSDFDKNDYCASLQYSDFDIKTIIQVAYVGYNKNKFELSYGQWDMEHGSINTSSVCNETFHSNEINSSKKYSDSLVIFGNTEAHEYLRKHNWNNSTSAHKILINVELTIKSLQKIFANSNNFIGSQNSLTNENNEVFSNLSSSDQFDFLISNFFFEHILIISRLSGIPLCSLKNFEFSKLIETIYYRRYLQHGYLASKNMKKINQPVTPSLSCGVNFASQTLPANSNNLRCKDNISHFVNVTSIDIVSAYPQIFVTFNLGPGSCMVTKTKHKNTFNIPLYNNVNLCSLKSPKNPLACVMNEFISLRKNAKVAKIEWLEKFYKRVTNIAFGLCCNGRHSHIFGEAYIGAAVTRYSRLMIQKLQTEITVKNCRVIYCATDSVFFVPIEKQGSNELEREQNLSDITNSLNLGFDQKFELRTEYKFKHFYLLSQNKYVGITNYICNAKFVKIVGIEKRIEPYLDIAFKQLVYKLLLDNESVGSLAKYFALAIINDNDEKKSLADKFNINDELRSLSNDTKISNQTQSFRIMSLLSLLPRLYENLLKRLFSFCGQDYDFFKFLFFINQLQHLVKTHKNCTSSNTSQMINSFFNTTNLSIYYKIYSFSRDSVKKNLSYLCFCKINFATNMFLKLFARKLTLKSLNENVYCISDTCKVGSIHCLTNNQHLRTTLSGCIETKFVISANGNYLNPPFSSLQTKTNYCISTKQSTLQQLLCILEILTPSLLRQDFYKKYLNEVLNTKLLEEKMLITPIGLYVVNDLNIVYGIPFY